jgi:hypothetical protein
MSDINLFSDPLSIALLYLIFGAPGLVLGAILGAALAQAQDLGRGGRRGHRILDVYRRRVGVGGELNSSTISAQLRVVQSLLRRQQLGSFEMVFEMHRAELSRRFADARGE